MRYFKVKTGYGANEFVSIDETELEKAQYLYMTDNKSFLGGVPVRGKDIITITEDWHREMGWNPHHHLGSDDWKELKDRGVLSRYTGVLAAAKDRVVYLMQSGQEKLIGTGVALPGLTAGKPSPIAADLAAAKRL